MVVNGEMEGSESLTLLNLRNQVDQTPSDDSPLVTSLRFPEGTGSLEVSFSILSTCASELFVPRG